MHKIAPSLPPSVHDAIRAEIRKLARPENCPDWQRQQVIVMNLAVHNTMERDKGGNCHLVSVTFDVVIDDAPQTCVAVRGLGEPFQSLKCEAMMSATYQAEPLGVRTLQQLNTDLEACSERSLWLLRSIVAVHSTCVVAILKSAETATASAIENAPNSDVSVRSQGYPTAYDGASACSHLRTRRGESSIDQLRQTGLHYMFQRLASTRAHRAEIGPVDRSLLWMTKIKKRSAVESSCSRLLGDSQPLAQRRWLCTGATLVPSKHRRPHDTKLASLNPLSMYDELKRARGRARAFSAKHSFSTMKEMDLGSLTLMPPAIEHRVSLPRHASAVWRKWANAEPNIGRKPKHSKVMENQVSRG